MSARPPEIKIVFQNEQWLVADKPPLCLSVSSRMGEADERPCLGRELEKVLGRQIYPVHRLDFEVSGLMVFALSSQAQRAASQWFEGRHIHKLYEAVTLGSGRDVGLTIEVRMRLVRGKRRSFEAPHGDSAETQVHLAERDKARMWDYWRLSPKTGRSHQLRVAMVKLGHPILGDTLYGGAADWLKPGIALRALQLDLREIAEAQRFGLPETLQVSSFWPV